MLHLELDDEEAHFLDGMLEEDAADQPQQHETVHEAQPSGPSAGYAPSSLSLMHRLSIHPPPQQQHQLRQPPMQHLPTHPEQPPTQHTAAYPTHQPIPEHSTPSIHPQATAEQLCRDYNDAAMHSLHAGQLTQAFDMLQLSLDLCRSATGADACGTGRQSSSPQPPPPPPAWPQAKWLAITYNNLACYYKRQAKPEAALHYLQLAAGLEGCASEAGGGSSEQAGVPWEAGGEAAGPGGGDARASTLLNLCTVLCSLGRHESALGHVDQALQLLSRAVAAGGKQAQGAAGPAKLLDPRALEAAAARPSARPPRAAQGCSDPAQLPEAQVWALLLAAPTSRVSLLAMALYNRAVVLEHLGRLGPAGRAYQAANNLACRAVGQGSGLAKTFGKSLQMFKLKLQAERRSAIKSKAGASSSSSGTPWTQQQLPAAARGAAVHAAGSAGWLRSASARKASSSGSLASASSSSLFPSPSCPGSVSSAPTCSGGASTTRSARLGRVPLLEVRDRAGPRPGLAAGSASSPVSSAKAGARASPYLSSPPPPPPRPPSKGPGSSPNTPGPPPRHASSPAAAAQCQHGTGGTPPAAAPREPPAPAARSLFTAQDLKPSPGAQLVEKWLQRHSALALDQSP